MMTELAVSRRGLATTSSGGPLGAANQVVVLTEMHILTFPKSVSLNVGNVGR